MQSDSAQVDAGAAARRRKSQLRGLFLPRDTGMAAGRGGGDKARGHMMRKHRRVRAWQGQRAAESPMAPFHARCCALRSEPRRVQGGVMRVARPVTVTRRGVTQVRALVMSQPAPARGHGLACPLAYITVH